MPLPAPKGQEEQPKFVSRCMGDATMNKEYPDQRQRAAICYSQYRRSKKRNESSGSIEEPQWEEQSIKGAVIIF